MTNKSNLSPVIHTSKPTANSKGGVEYVELSGAEATRIMMTHGVKHLMDMFGLGHVQPWDIYLSNSGYGDARTFCLRVKRDVAEGKAPPPRETRAESVKPVWTAPGTVAQAQGRGRRRA